MTTRKHRRINRDRFDRAWSIVQEWYADQARDRAVRYSVGGNRVSVQVDDQGGGDTLERAKRDRPKNWTRPTKLTADGREQRHVLSRDAERGFWGVSTDPGIGRATGAVPAPRSLYLRDVMRCVAALSPDAHRVLEMRAATWDFPAVAEEMGCSEPTARQYFSEGIGLVMSYVALVKPAKVLQEDDEDG